MSETTGQTSILAYYGSRKSSTLRVDGAAGPSKPAAKADAEAVTTTEAARARKKGKKRVLDEAAAAGTECNAEDAENVGIVFEREALSDTDSEEELEDVQETMHRLKADIRVKVQRRLRSLNARKTSANAELSMIINEINGLGQGIVNARGDTDKAFMKKRRALLLAQIGDVLVRFNPAYAGVDARVGNAVVDEE